MKNIVLIGMSGVGKSEIGRYLAESMGVAYLDTDEMITQREKLTVNDIFEKHGEEYFRDVESEIIKEVSKKDNHIISTGGGVVIRNENISALQDNGYIFLLLGKIDTILHNLTKTRVIRPLLKESQDLKNRVESLYSEREQMYLLSSHVIVNVDHKEIAEIGKEIMMEYEKLLSRNI